MAIETPIKLSTNPEALTDEREFLGEITADEIVPGLHGAQYHYAVRPLTFAIGGKTGWFHEYFKISTAKRSKLGICILRLGETFGKNLPLGEGSLVGLQGWFVRQDIEFGTDRQTGEVMKAEAVLLACRPMASGDEALIVNDGSVSPAAAAGTGPTVAAPSSFSDEEIGLLLSALEGADASRLAVVAARSNLPAPLKQAVMSGTALTALSDLGLVSVEGGTVISTTTPPAAEAAAPTTRRPAFAAKS